MERRTDQGKLEAAAGKIQADAEEIPVVFRLRESTCQQFHRAA